MATQSTKATAPLPPPVRQTAGGPSNPPSSNSADRIARNNLPPFSAAVSPYAPSKPPINPNVHGPSHNDNKEAGGAAAPKHAVGGAGGGAGHGAPVTRPQAGAPVRAPLKHQVGGNN